MLMCTTTMANKILWQVWFSLWWTRKMKWKVLSSGRGLEGMELMVLGCFCGKGWGMGEMPAGAISWSIWSIRKCMYWKSGSFFSFEMWLKCWRETEDNNRAIEILRSLKRVNWIVQTVQCKIVTEILNWSYWILHVYNWHLHHWTIIINPH